MRLFKTARQFFATLPRDYWHVQEPMGQNFAAGAVRGYYIDMRQKAGDYHGPSQDGFPLRNQNQEGLQLLPVTITQLALGHYEFWLNDEAPWRIEQFLRCAEWLIEHHATGPHGLKGWLYFFPHRRLGIEPPFISAMGQGQGISVLIRAHQLTKDEKYLTAAKQALDIFEYEVKEGGVKVEIDAESTYYEEYPCLPYSHVLNGHIFAIWGLYDYAVYLQDDHVMRLFNRGVSAMKKYLPRYDTGFWSCYDLYPHTRPNFASPFYHELHIAQLRAMFKLTNVQEFDDFANKWEKQFDNWFNFARAFYAKIALKVRVKARKKKLPQIPALNREA